MAGFQFIHVEGYASVSKMARSRSGQPVTARRRWSAAQVLDEASRTPKACSHIARPDPRPQWLLGSREAVDRAGADWLANTMVGKRKARSDAPWLLAGVVSLPRSEEAELWGDFAPQVVTWLEQRYGKRLRAVVQHLDEAHPHVHFYAVPLPGEAFGVIHEGYAAKTAARQARERNTGQAYVAAMRQLQDEFQTGFAWAFGLARTGPRRPRLTRAQWREEQALAEAKAAEQHAKEVVSSAMTTRRVVLDRTAGDAAQMKADAEALRKEVEDAETRLQQSRNKAASRFTSMRGRLREDRRVLREMRLELDQVETALTTRSGELDQQEATLAQRAGELGMKQAELDALTLTLDKHKAAIRAREIQIQALVAALSPDEQREAANRLPGELERRQATLASPRPAEPAVAPSRPVQQSPQRAMKPKMR